MKKTKIQADSKFVLIECPECTAWETASVDEARGKMHTFPITHWEGEESVHECTECKSKFKVEWDYNNPLK